MQPPSPCGSWPCRAPPASACSETRSSTSTRPARTCSSTSEGTAVKIDGVPCHRLNISKHSCVLNALMNGWITFGNISPSITRISHPHIIMLSAHRPMRCMLSAAHSSTRLYPVNDSWAGRKLKIYLFPCGIIFFIECKSHVCVYFRYNKRINDIRECKEQALSHA